MTKGYGSIETSTWSTRGTNVNRGIAILDFFLRVLAIIGTLASAIAMGTTNETLPFLNQFARFRAKYTDLPEFTFFVVANSIVCVYLVFSLALSIFHIVKATAESSRIILIIFDTAMMGLLSAGASAAASIVYLAHNGDAKINWFGICRQFSSFCDRISGSLIGSFAGVVLLILLILMSALVLARR